MVQEDQAEGVLRKNAKKSANVVKKSVSNELFPLLNFCLRKEKT